MGERSPNQSPSSYFGNSPARNQHIGVRQPIYLQPNSPSMTPRGCRMSSPKNGSGSPDFIPLGISSPVARARHSWRSNSYSNNSYSSVSSTPTSSNSSFSNSPYSRNGHRSHFRGRGIFNNSWSASPHISLYVHKDMLEDPWTKLDVKPKDYQNSRNATHTSDSEGTQESAVVLESGSEVSDSDT